MYALDGRPSIPPERLLKASLLISLYSVRSERAFCEQLDYNELFRWFLGMNLIEPSFDPSTFSKNRQRLLDHNVAQQFFDEIVLAASRLDLAAYAGLGPTPWKSCTSINANMLRRFGNHRVKNALFLAAFASPRHEPSRTYYDRKRAQGKRHNQAVLCLARRRVDVLHAMLSCGVPYRSPAPPAAAA